MLVQIGERHPYVGNFPNNHFVKCGVKTQTTVLEDADFEVLFRMLLDIVDQNVRTIDQGVKAVIERRIVDKLRNRAISFVHLTYDLFQFNTRLF